MARLHKSPEELDGFRAEHLRSTSVFDNVTTEQINNGLSQVAQAILRLDDERVLDASKRATKDLRDRGELPGMLYAVEDPTETTEGDDDVPTDRS